MSLTMLEKVLYDLGVDRAAKKAFRDDPEALLRTYRLTDDEVDLIRQFDLHELAARGVNPMLLMGYWRLSGKSMPAYLRRIAEPLNAGTPAGQTAAENTHGRES